MLPLSPDERDSAFPGEDRKPAFVEDSASPSKWRSLLFFFAGYGEADAPVCVDTNKFCGDWALRGECDKNPGYMADACCLSCGEAGRGEPTAQAAVTTSSVIFLTTEYGPIRIAASPRAAALVRTLSDPGHLCDRCTFYRAEPPSDSGTRGPPYGLLQGRFSEALFPPRGGGFEELAGSAARGVVSGIPGTGDWLIHLQGHPEWEGAFVELGKVLEEDMHVVYRIAMLPTHSFTHPDYHTDMLMLDAEVPFSLNVEVSTVM